MRILYSCAVYQNSILQTGVCASQSSGTPSMLNCSYSTRSVQPHFAVVNCSDVGMSVLLRCFNAQPDIFAVMNCCVVALSLFSSDILIWSANSLYSVQWHIK